MDEKQNENIVVNVCSYISRHRFRCSIDEPTCLFVHVLGDKKSDCKNKYDEAWMGTNIVLSEMACNRESKKGLSTHSSIYRSIMEFRYKHDFIPTKKHNKNSFS